MGFRIFFRIAIKTIILQLININFLLIRINNPVLFHLIFLIKPSFLYNVPGSSRRRKSLYYNIGSTKTAFIIYLILFLDGWKVKGSFGGGLKKNYSSSLTLYCYNLFLKLFYGKIISKFFIWRIME
ncbi:MAG: hypothetical protein BWY64_03584 [bacterium ADurb.Bin363]|nr:MAG: hypothetical protein BWY64_03584 [bacterium ADurb.Bin363]